MTPDPTPGGSPSDRTETATLGGGCFWCTEAIFAELNGVRSVEPGYAGGTTPHPSYEDVCTGETGHAEVVQVTFDPDVLTYADLLRVFLTVHDPTTRDRQGGDVGTQYRSIILAHDDRQRAEAEKVIREIGQAKLWTAPIVTEVAAFRAFYPAEGYHREYYQRNPEKGYCQLVIAPKVAKFRKAFLHRLQAPPHP
jgi:peptide-methionine (S)-S-oxide reductase